MMGMLSMPEIQKKFCQLPINLLGRFLYYFLPIRRKIVKQNIELVFQKTLSKGEKKHLALAFYSHLVMLIKEVFFLFSFQSISQLERKVEIRGTEYLLKAAELQKGVLILTGHLGSWEFTPVIGLQTITGFKGQFYVIRKRIKNKFLENFLFRRWHKNGLTVIDKKGSLRKVYRALAANHAVLFPMDQHGPLESKQGIAVEFFAKEAGTYRSLASLAHRSGAPVVPSVCYRLKNGKHVLEFYPQLEWLQYTVPEEAIYYNTRLYNQILEKLILIHPEQWLWSHRRWKL